MSYEVCRYPHGQKCFVKCCRTCTCIFLLLDTYEHSWHLSLLDPALTLSSVLVEINLCNKILLSLVLGNTKFSSLSSIFLQMDASALVFLQTIESLFTPVILHTGLIISVHLSARMSKFLLLPVFILQNTSASLTTARSTSLYGILLKLLAVLSQSLTQ